MVTSQCVCLRALLVCFLCVNECLHYIYRSTSNQCSLLGRICEQPQGRDKHRARRGLDGAWSVRFATTWQGGDGERLTRVACLLVVVFASCVLFACCLLCVCVCVYVCVCHYGQI